MTAVSIILPSFERLQLLREAVGSVLEQTHDDWELIIADDGSGEPTRDWLRTLSGDSRVRLLWLEHRGNPAAARNAALAAARGEYVAFLDSDDRWLPHKLATQLAAQRAARGPRWSYSAFARIGSDGARIRESQPWWTAARGDIFGRLLDFAAVVPTPTVMVERRLLAEIGAFDESLAQFEDYELWLRLARASPVLLVDEPLVEVRSHDQHYFRAGLPALERWRRMLECVGEQSLDGSQRAALTAAHRINTLRLARGYAARGDRAAAAAMLDEGSRAHGDDPHWWLGAFSTRLYAAAPGWMRDGYRRLRGRIAT